MTKNKLIVGILARLLRKRIETSKAHENRVFTINPLSAKLIFQGQVQSHFQGQGQGHFQGQVQGHFQGQGQGRSQGRG